MSNPKYDRAAYHAALQFEHLVFRILDRSTAKHLHAADELAQYTHQMLRCLRKSNTCVGTKRGQEESIQAAVWLVELLIVLNDLSDSGGDHALITAGMEILERIEEALRAEGSLPPARDSQP